MDERKQKDEEESYGVVGLMAGATFMGDHVGLLSQYDHTGDPNRRIAGEEDVHTAEDSLRNMLAFFEGDKTEGHEETRTRVIKDLQETLVGFDYRKKNKLPGLATQFDEARRQLVSGEEPTALDVLAKQPDAVELVAQLRAEYETFEEVMDKGGELDLDKLEIQIRQINHGLSFVNMNEAIGRWSALKDLEAKLAGSTALAEAQERSSLLVRLGETAKKFESDIAAQAAHNLDNVIGRLQMNGTLGHGDENRYAGEIARLRREHKGVKLLSQTLKKADRLTVGMSGPDVTPIDIEAVTEDLRRSMEEVAALKASIDKLREREMKWGGIPIVGSGIRAERDRIYDKLIAADREGRRLTARLEIAKDYNTLAGFLAEVTGEAKTKDEA